MRLIDAEWLLNFFEPYPNDYQTPLGSLRACVDDAPSIDICFCEECMHNGSYDTDCPFGWKNGEWNMPKPCDFCSYGERSEL